MSVNELPFVHCAHAEAPKWRVTLPDLQQLFLGKYGEPSKVGWSPALRYAHQYYSPSDYYEAVLEKLIQPDTRWLDVGAGKAPVPNNPHLCRTLADRCQRFVGIDGSDNIKTNPYVHAYDQCYLQDYRTEEKFDVITLRMVAEHVTDPPTLAQSLRGLVAPGGRVVIYTINLYALVSWVSRFTPFWFHQVVKQAIWKAKPEDTFPVAYKMNTRADLQQLFAEHGFAEEFFAYLDDLQTFANTKPLLQAELAAWKLLHRLRLKYVETCLLGVYRVR